MDSFPVTGFFSWLSQHGRLFIRLPLRSTIVLPGQLTLGAVAAAKSQPTGLEHRLFMKKIKTAKQVFSGEGE
jgi:hypothetical protein